MKIKLQNIGIIEQADINVGGITLIAGQNDSGKSTVGKVLYSLIRSFNINEKSFNISKNEYVRNRVRDIRNLILRTKVSNENDRKILEDIVNNYIFNSESTFERLGTKFNNNNPNAIDRLTEELATIQFKFSAFSNETLKTQIDVFVTEIVRRLQLQKNSPEVLHYELDSFFQNEFGDQIKNKFSKESSYLSIEKNKILFDEGIQFEGFETTLDYLYDDVFFIESPIKLQDSSYSIGDSMLRDKSSYLNSKIFEPESDQDIFSDNRENFERLNGIISSVINGTIDINNNNELVFKKSGEEFDFNSIATGIKSFGILQMLIKKGHLNSNTLLIIDEPEVHLHPSWQVNYAEILVRLSKEFAIPIVLTSHSPYFIEALEVYTKKYEFQDSTNFYFAQKNNDGLSSNLIEVTENISPILTSISEAFYKIQDINDKIQ